MGHILAQRYLHPKCYRSEFKELSSWLNNYSDLPQAKRIYRLAIKRMPQGYKRPKSPSKAFGVEESNFEIIFSTLFTASLFKIVSIMGIYFQFWLLCSCCISVS